MIQEPEKQLKTYFKDEISALLFDGWIRYYETDDETFLGDMVRSYFAQAPDSVRKDSIDLFLTAEEKLHQFSSLPPMIFFAVSYSDIRQFRFLVGLGAPVKAVCCLKPDLTALTFPQSVSILSAENLTEYLHSFPSSADFLFVFTGSGTKSVSNIGNLLKQNGISPSRIISVRQIWDDTYTDLTGCYFDSNLIKLNHQECFVDGGSLDLFHAHRFSRKTKGYYQAIYAFEPDPCAFNECRQNLALFDNRLHLLNAALWDSNTTINFQSAQADSRYCPEGTISVQAVSLDHIMKDCHPTMIKLHLEGSELPALRGATKTIRRCHPKLAIVLGHQKEDIITIPTEILHIDPTYRFYLRHYSSGITETVLYAL